MHRRDLLLLRATPRAKVYELPCQRLYMHYLDIRRPNVAELDGGHDYHLGEPEPQYSARDARELFDGLTRELQGADVLRVVGHDWLADADLKHEVDRAIAAFSARGGRVEFLRA